MEEGSMDAKRMAGNYEITCSILIGDKEIVLGENLQDTDGVPIANPTIFSSGITML